MWESTKRAFALELVLLIVGFFELVKRHWEGAGLMLSLAVVFAGVALALRHRRN